MNSKGEIIVQIGDDWLVSEGIFTGIKMDYSHICLAMRFHDPATNAYSDDDGLRHVGITLTAEQVREHAHHLLELADELDAGAHR